MTIMFVFVAFALGVWVGAGWSAVIARRYKSERDEVFKRATALANSIERAIAKQAL